MSNNTNPKTGTAEKSSYPNETMRLLFERASCRSFSDRNIPADVLRMVLEAGTHAPTGGNLQPYSIIKIENLETRGKFAELCGQKFIGEAPVNLVFCIDLRRLERWAELETAPFTATSSFRHFWVSFQDTMICAQNICTAADAMGLGSVYIGTVLEIMPQLREMLQLPKDVFPVVLLCLGYPKIKAAPRKKLGTDVVVHDEKYREMEDSELLRAFNEKYSGRDDRRLDITEERINTIFEVCQKVRNDDFAKKCVEKIKQNGYINSVQRYFGLHYRADRMPQGNTEYLRIMEASGFNWFKDFEQKRSALDG
jgi:nitroreductase